MAKTKFYAVKEGHTTGIFTSWEECKVAIEGYPKSIHKSFSTIDEAKAFLVGDDIYKKQVEEDLANGYAVAYTDGSYDATTNRYAYGICIFDKEGNETSLCNVVNYPPFASSRNIAGEIYGVLTALDWAVSNGYEKIKIYHDLESISKWATGEFDANSDIAKYYIKQLNDKFKDCITYEFIKVKGHSNNPYNEKADQLASSALKGERKMIKGAHSFSVSNFEKSDIETIIELIMEENPEAKTERKIILGGEQIKLSFGKSNTMIKMYNNRKLLVQGKPNAAYQIVFTYISELLGEKRIIPLAKQAYRIKVDVSTVEGNFNNLCPNIPDTYNANIRTLIRQAIINLNGYFEAEEYGQYAFPALRAMEGHIKLLFSNQGVTIGRGFEQFDGNPSVGFVLKPEFSIPAPFNKNIQDCYNFYHRNRHKIFHFGDMIGTTDNTMIISTKEDADTIIRGALKLINDTIH